MNLGVEELLYDYDGGRFPEVFCESATYQKIGRRIMPNVTKQNRNDAPRVVSGKTMRRLSSAWDVDDTLSLLMYGRSGTGKTTIWATFPGPILVMVCSGGKRPGELKSIATPEMKKKITALVVNECSDVVNLLKEVEQEKFKTVVLDHASGLQDLKLKEILGLEEIPAQKGWGLATQQQYAQCALECKEMLRRILNLPCHRVIVAQEREFDSNAGADGASELITPYVGAALMPSLTGWLNAACDYIGETFLRQKVDTVTKSIGGKEVEVKSRTNKAEYCLRTAPHAVYTTKFRLPKGHVLPDAIVDPTFDKILKIIRGES